MSFQDVIEVAGEDEAEVGFETGPALTRIRLWDLPTRVFHWSLVLAVSVAVRARTRRMELPIGQG